MLGDDEVDSRRHSAARAIGGFLALFPRVAVAEAKSLVTGPSPGRRRDAHPRQGLADHDPAGTVWPLLPVRHAPAPILFCRLQRQALPRLGGRRGTQLLERLRHSLGGEGPDVAAITALLIGGAYYLAIASQRSALFNGIDLRSDHGRRRIEAAIETVVSLVIDATSTAFGPGAKNG